MVLMQRDDEPADHEQAHSDMISDIVDVTGEAFLGTTMGCAKCHDHKADPILQSDYYSMMSFFDTIALSHLKSANKAWYNEEEELERERSEDAISTAWKTVDTGRLDEFVKRSECPEAMIRMGYVENETRESKWQILPEVPEDPRWISRYQPKITVKAWLHFQRMIMVSMWFSGQKKARFRQKVLIILRCRTKKSHWFYEKSFDWFLCRSS